MKPIKVRVTKQDIKNGIPTAKRQCPIALALLRYGFKDVEVGNTVMQIGDRFYYQVSKRMRNFIEKFDRTGSTRLRPFSFTFHPETYSK